ncbi:hypothetical protein COV19_03170 [Candidatus Woesearchaeota archaeon CG10_big_fil_rev_8_21_14_0_10_44_13]|nr:MAG: hypothetical protein COV19_03170 [Candidatus Woesearchaeota archaeon CG10_big_fil_rev_8_21_14_0_10_44_13]
MIQLGGNIQLEGFEALEPGKLVVVKKMVGNYARQISDSNKDFEKLSMVLKKEGGMFELKAAAIIAGKESSKVVNDSRLFYGLDNALNGLMGLIK